MKKYFYYILLILNLSCSNRNESSLVKETSRLKNKIYDNYNNHPLYDHCIQTIIQSKSIDDKYIYLNQTSPTYYCYETLEQILPDSVWINFIQHPSPNMRYYAFKALEKRNYNKISEIKMELIKDSTIVTYRSGCLEIGILRICDLVK